MSFSFTGLDHVQLAAPKGSEEVARQFFSGILGMTEILKPANLAVRGGVWFQAGAHQLHIGVQEDFTPATKAHPAFQVKSLELLRRHLIVKGIEMRDDEPLEGSIRFYVNDPFGNRLEFIEWL